MMDKTELKVQANSPYNDGYTREFYQQELDKMEQKVNTDAYLEFVDAVTSEQSKSHEAFVYRIQELEGQEFPTERLLTAAVGMSAEAGEFTEIVKKIVFQGKPVNEENLFHMKRELGDIMWYVAQACMGLNTSIDEIIEMNVEKLEKRYPGGSFDVHYSENRKQGDL
jgi:NTP pyrophosphatase (non-canonical NTP hydrolase)